MTLHVMTRYGLDDTQGTGFEGALFYGEVGNAQQVGTTVTFCAQSDM